MVSGVVCIELLITTIVAWVGLWGLVEEALSNITEKKWKCAAYGALLGGALLVAAAQQQLSVCALL